MQQVSYPPVKAVQKVIHHAKDIDGLAKYASYIDSINKLIISKLPKKIASHWIVTNYKNNILYLETHSAVWMQPLLSIKYELLVSLRAIPQYSKLKDLKLTVHPESQIEKRPNQQLQHTKSIQRHLSTTSAQLLLNTATQIKHPKLAQALINLANYS